MPISVLQKIRRRFSQHLPSDCQDSSKPDGEIQDEGHSHASAGIGGVSLNFIQTVVKKLPDLVDGNPIKIAFSVAKVIIDAKDAFQDTKIYINHCFLDAAERIQVVQAATNDGSTVPDGAENALTNFMNVMQAIFRDLEALKTAPTAAQVLDYEDRARKIQQIFRRINTATEQFQIAMSIAIQITANGIQRELKIQALESLKPSPNAQYNSRISGRSLKREACTVGTRTKILEDMFQWADDPSSAPVFWLTGQAGSGKTTILYTVAKAVDSQATKTQLGGNFFCSRQFAETREPNRILPTVVYGLAQICKPFGDALYASKISQAVPNPFNTVSLDIDSQLKNLLVTPWQQCQAARAEKHSQYLIVIDALDEMEECGATEFLQNLFEVIRTHTLSGLKFLVASRTDPSIQQQMESFPTRKEIWLQHVLADEASADIETYLQRHLSHLGPEYISKICDQADGLFIHAATVIRLVKPPGLDLALKEQLSLLDSLLSSSPHAQNTTSGLLIDNLYQQIMIDAFSGLSQELLQHRLKILHYFLCTSSRETPETIAAIIGDDDDAVAKRVVDGLHAVLYLEPDGRIFWYHASFPDFIFDPSRSRFFHLQNKKEYNFSCNQSALRSDILNCCFDLLNTHLRFNYAGNASSFMPDQHTNRPDINQALVYSACEWCYHLPEGNAGPAIGTAFTLLHEFLNIRVLFWVEFMNVMKRVDDCAFFLRLARSWAIKICGSNDTIDTHRLPDKLLEVILFADAYASTESVEIQTHSPHLYLSHLACWEKGPLTVQRWKDNFQGLPILNNTRTANIQYISSPGQDAQSLQFWPAPCILGELSSICRLSNDALVVSGHKDGILRIWDLVTGNLLADLWDDGQSVTSLATCGSFILSGFLDASVGVWEPDSGRRLCSLYGHYDGVVIVDGSQSGTRVVSGSLDETVRVWDLVAGHWEALTILEGHSHAVHAVALSHDASFVASGSADMTVRIWDIAMGSAICVFIGHSEKVNAVAFSPDTSRVVSGSGDSTVRMWSIADSQEQLCLCGHSGAVYSVKFTHDGRRIVSGSADATIRLWDAENGEQIRVFSGHITSVVSVTISTDDSRVVSGSDDGSIRVWDISGQRRLVSLKNDFVDDSEAHQEMLGPGGQDQWRILENGWVVSSDSDDHKLFWVNQRDPDTSIADPSNILTISADGYRFPDLSRSWHLFGDRWSECYVPSS